MADLFPVEEVLITLDLAKETPTGILFSFLSRCADGWDVGRYLFPFPLLFGLAHVRFHDLTIEHECSEYFLFGLIIEAWVFLGTWECLGDDGLNTLWKYISWTSHI